MGSSPAQLNLRRQTPRCGSSNATTIYPHKPFAVGRSRSVVAGRLIYDQLGASAETAFLRAWGLGVLIEHATQWREVVEALMEAALIYSVLDALGLFALPQYLERELDFASVQARSLTRMNNELPARRACLLLSV